MGVFRLLEEQDSRMKLLCLPSLLVFCLSLAEAADFKHFPVQAGRQDSAKSQNRGAPAPARPPGNRERVLGTVRKDEGTILDPASDYSDEDEDVPRVRVASTTERVRVNRNRNRTRTRIVTSERKVETTAKPVRRRTRIRTPAPRLETSTRRQRPTVEIATFTTIGLKETATEPAALNQFNDFPVDKQVLKQAFNQAKGTFAMDPFLQTDSNPKTNFPTPKLIPSLPSEEASQTFSQSLTGLFHPTSSPTVSRKTEERQKQRFKQAKTQPTQQSVFQAQTKPPPLRVLTENQPFVSRAEPIQLQPIQAQPFQTQHIQALPIQTQPQAQPFQAQPFQAQPFQAQPFQTSLPAGNTGQLLSQTPAPIFQDRPSLFNTLIEVPQQQEGAGASFSYSAVVG